MVASSRMKVGFLGCKMSHMRRIRKMMVEIKATAIKVIRRRSFLFPSCWLQSFAVILFSPGRNQDEEKIIRFVSPSVAHKNEHYIDG